MLPNYSIFFYRRFKNRYFFRSCFKFIPRQIEPYVEADWSPRYAVNSGLLTKIKGFKMRDRGSICLGINLKQLLSGDPPFIPLPPQSKII